MEIVYASVFITKIGRWYRAHSFSGDTEDPCPREEKWTLLISNVRFEIFFGRLGLICDCDNKVIWIYQNIIDQGNLVYIILL